MPILIVDNGTSYLAQLSRLVQHAETVVVSWHDISGSDALAGYAGAILSGGHQLPIAGNEEKFANEIEMVRSASVPVLGVCFGFELIAVAFGGHLQEMPHGEKGMLDMDAITHDPVFSGVKHFRVHENHRWVAKDLPPELVPLAVSRDGVEIIRHITKPIYGFQFHPELVEDCDDGRQLFENATKLLFPGSRF